MIYFFVIAIVLGIFVWYIFNNSQTNNPFMGKNKEQKNINNLRKEYKLRAKLSPATADEIIDSHIDKLKIRKPGESEVWYLEKILYDLERDFR